MERGKNKCISFFVLFSIVCLFSLHITYQRYGFNNATSKIPQLLTQKHEKNWINAMEEKYSKINERIQNVCKKINNTKRKWTHDSVGVASLQTKLMLDTPHNLAACLNPKVGSTTWEATFYQLLPKKIVHEIKSKVRNNKNLDTRSFVRTKYNGLSLIGNLTEHRSQNDLMDHKLTYNDWKIYKKKNKILTFTFVRHPFVRLVSAYQFLIVENQAKYLYGHHPWIKKWYKKNHSFSSFVNLVLQKYKVNFVNGHWVPFYTHCNLCEVDYDVIGRMETFSDDFRFIIKKKKLQKIIPLSQAKLTVMPSNKRAENKHIKHKNTQKMAKSLMSQLTKSQFDGLYNMYRYDFDMFGYDANQYST